MDLTDLINKFPSQENLSVQPRPYFNHSIELKKPCTAKERSEMMDKVGLNVFYFPSELISGCDFLSDSGTTTMTNEQWAALHLGDEAYGSNKGYFILMNQIRETFGKEFFNGPLSGKPNAFIFHLGRSAEHALCSVLGKQGEGLIIPSNGHFDTTEANIEANKIQAVNLFSPELKDPESKSCFKGNMDAERLKELLEKNPVKSLLFI
ncbi:MAG: beta-eliminating lyase-related protein [Candidatus Diapherotrites archaeon]